MKKITRFLQSGVHIKTSHLWMIALGVVIALGFFINCLVAPFYLGCAPINETELILSASIVAGLGTAREAVLYRFKYLQDLQPPLGDRKTAENVLKEKLWIPCIGWFLCGGFAVNYLLLPFFDWIRPVDWGFLQSALGIFLTISGTREVSIYAQNNKTRKAGAEETEGA